MNFFWNFFSVVLAKVLFRILKFWVLIFFVVVVVVNMWPDWGKNFKALLLRQNASAFIDTSPELFFPVVLTTVLIWIFEFLTLRFFTLFFFRKFHFHHCVIYMWGIKKKLDIFSRSPCRAKLGEIWRAWISIQCLYRVHVPLRVKSSMFSLRTHSVHFRFPTNLYLANGRS